MRAKAAALLGKVGTQWLLFFMSLSLTLPAVSVGLRCGSILVARTRRKFCQHRV